MTPTANARGATSRGVPGTRPKEFAHGALRGAIAAMAMTGMRAFTVGAGIVEEPPPRAILRQRAKGTAEARAAQPPPRGGRALPLELRRRRRRHVRDASRTRSGCVAGPAPRYGLAIWAGFEAGIAPALGLSQAKRPRPLDRVGLALDHLLYGFVLSEMRSRPRS